MNTLITEKHLQNLLKTYFGFDAFRPSQREIIENVLAGQDTLVIMPTGGGKSLCYQLPALAFSGLTLVISPLISLMKDQVDSLLSNGIHARYINSSLSREEALDTRDDCLAGKVKILFVAPERFTVPGFLNLLKSLSVSLVAVDEAHCISQWGHDFRPDYRNLNHLKTIFPQIPLIALTATATPKVQTDIAEQLSMKEFKKAVTGFDRANLEIQVLRKKNAFQKTLSLLKMRPGESSIIYCFSRRETLEVAEKLNGVGIKALPYHAGLDNDVRNNTQEAFVKDEIQVITATLAFGMGIDKPDVRLVIHYTFPKSIEGYYQEIGRAGRDGLPAKCVLLYSYGDKRKHDFFIEKIEDDARKQAEMGKLRDIIRYCELSACRRKYLLTYFGEEREEDCGNCDVCARQGETFNATEPAQKILSAVIRTNNMFGKNHVLDVLKGSKSQKIIQRNHHELSVYGIAGDTSRDLLDYVFKACFDRELLLKNSGEYPTFQISPKGRSFLKERQPLYIPKLPEEYLAEPPVKQDFDTVFFKQLRVFRKKLADQKGVPPFVIFGDKTLREMAVYFPQTVQQFGRLYGVGQKKLEELSPVFLPVIQSYCKENNITSQEFPVRQPQAQKQSKKTPVNKNRYAVTQNMLARQIPLSEIAGQQNLKKDTIFSHIDRLLEAGEHPDISYLKPKPELYGKISKAYAVCGAKRLKPVYEYLEGKVDYDTIRLVGLLEKAIHTDRESAII